MNRAPETNRQGPHLGWKYLGKTMLRAPSALYIRFIVRIGFRAEKLDF